MVTRGKAVSWCADAWMMNVARGVLAGLCIALLVSWAPAGGAETLSHCADQDTACAIAIAEPSVLCSKPGGVRQCTAVGVPGGGGYFGIPVPGRLNLQLTATWAGFACGGPVNNICDPASAHTKDAAGECRANEWNPSCATTEELSLGTWFCIGCRACAHTFTSSTAEAYSWTGAGVTTGVGTVATPPIVIERTEVYAADHAYACIS